MTPSVPLLPFIDPCKAVQMGNKKLQLDLFIFFSELYTEVGE